MFLYLGGMSNDENNTPVLTWTRRKPDGISTYDTDVTVDGVRWSFTIDKPRNTWVVRGWADGTFGFYREGNTLRFLKDTVAEFVGKGCRK